MWQAARQRVSQRKHRGRVWHAGITGDRLNPLFFNTFIAYFSSILRLLLLFITLPFKQASYISLFLFFVFFFLFILSFNLSSFHIFSFPSYLVLVFLFISFIFHHLISFALLHTFSSFFFSFRFNNFSYSSSYFVSFFFPFIFLFLIILSNPLLHVFFFLSSWELTESLDIDKNEKTKRRRRRNQVSKNHFKLNKFMSKKEKKEQHCKS